VDPFGLCKEEGTGRSNMNAYWNSVANNAVANKSPTTYVFAEVMKSVGNFVYDVPDIAKAAIADPSGTAHVALDAGGMAPAVGIVPDAINALFYLAEGDLVNASLSGTAMIPVLGQGATATKYGAKIVSKVDAVATPIVKKIESVKDVAVAKFDKIIELNPGKKGGWNKLLNGKLEPMANYQVGDYLYKTDELGRVKSVSGELDLSKVDRNTYQQGKAGKIDGIKDGLAADEGGHLIASIFKGPGEQINYAAMDGNLNKGAWKSMENDWAKALKGEPPQRVEVEINAIYDGNSKRPSAFDVFYEIDGQEEFVSFRNVAGGK